MGAAPADVIEQCHRCHRIGTGTQDHAMRFVCGYCARREGIDLIGFDDEPADYWPEGPE